MRDEKNVRDKPGLFEFHQITGAVKAPLRVAEGLSLCEIEWFLFGITGCPPWPSRQPVIGGINSHLYYSRG